MEKRYCKNCRYFSIQIIKYYWVGTRGINYYCSFGLDRSKKIDEITGIEIKESSVASVYYYRVLNKDNNCKYYCECNVIEKIINKIRKFIFLFFHYYIPTKLT